MTLPERCDNCGGVLAVWDPTKDTPCKICGATVITWEHLSPEEARRRMRLIARRERIEEARKLEVRGDVL